jgi:Phage integrase, N-terminal SAM-like domain
VDVRLSTSTALATRDELFSAGEQLALAGFLAGYSGLTREAYTLDLRQYVAWCTEHRVALFGARRADIECFARHLESLGRARATIARRLCTVACFYRYAEQEGLIAVRRPPMCGDPVWTTTLTPLAWIATRSAPCWSPPGSPVAGFTR